MWKVLRFPVAIAGVALAALLASDGTLSAASYTVNSTIDAVDANPGDGVCATAAGECTLRAAVMEANALPGRDIINVPAGTYTLTIEQEPGGPGGNTASSGDLNISDDLEIKGVGANESIIDGGRFTGIIEHVFSVRTASVVISDVTIQNGGWLNSPAGGIFNIGGQVTLNDTVFNGNEGSTGAAVWNAGTLTVHGGAFLYNGAPDSESKDGAIS